MDLKDKVVIVTGASSGIGMETAKALHQLGAKLVLVARSTKKLESLSNELNNSIYISADLSIPDAVKQMVEVVITKYGKIDILINNAGRGYDALIEDIDLKYLNEIYQLNFVGALVAMQSVIPIMKRNKSGSIIFISSGTALLHLVGMGGYASLKAAMSHLCLTAREELKDQNINISVVYPYITDTDFEKNTLTNGRVEVSNSQNFIPPEADPPEFVAQLIIDAITNGEAEVFAHEWMNR